MRELWRRLEAIAEKTPKPLFLRPPATESAIRAAEKTMKIDFPSDFRESLLVHDGQEEVRDDEDDDTAFEWLPHHGRLASLDRIVAEHAGTCQTHDKFYGDGSEPPRLLEDDRLYHYFWHPKRIPIAGNNWFDQDNTYLDFFPGPSGAPGQLVMFGKACFGAWIGPSFRAALELYVTGFEKGEWIFKDGCSQPRAKKMSWLKYVKKHLG